MFINLRYKKVSKIVHLCGTDVCIAFVDESISQVLKYPCKCVTRKKLYLRNEAPFSQKRASKIIGNLNVSGNNVASTMFILFSAKTRNLEHRDIYHSCWIRWNKYDIFSWNLWMFVLSSCWFQLCIYHQIHERELPNEVAKWMLSSFENNFR